MTEEQWSAQSSRHQSIAALLLLFFFESIFLSPMRLSFAFTFIFFIFFFLSSLACVREPCVGDGHATRRHARHHIKRLAPLSSQRRARGVPLMDGCSACNSFSFCWYRGWGKGE